jgi:hypothetical protein
VSSGKEITKAYSVQKYLQCPHSDKFRGIDFSGRWRASQFSPVHRADVKKILIISIYWHVCCCKLKFEEVQVMCTPWWILKPRFYILALPFSISMLLCMAIVVGVFMIVAYNVCQWRLSVCALKYCRYNEGLFGQLQLKYIKQSLSFNTINSLNNIYPPKFKYFMKFCQLHLHHFLHTCCYMTQLVLSCHRR